MLKISENDFKALKGQKKKPRQKPRKLEHILQCAAVEWTRYRWPGIILHSIPNGARTSIAVACRLKAEGLLAGVPDLFAPEPRRGYHGMYAETKIKGNYASKKQKDLMKLLRAKGYYVFEYRCMEEYKLHAEFYFGEQLKRR